MKVRSYGKLASFLGAEREIDVRSPCPVADLRAQLAAECPEAAEALGSRRVLVCIGDAMVPDTYVAAPDDVIELLSPVSGG